MWQDFSSRGSVRNLRTVPMLYRVGGNGVFSFVSVSHYPTHFLIGNKIIFPTYFPDRRMSAWNTVSEAPSLQTEGPQSLHGACCSVYSHDILATEFLTTFLVNTLSFDKHQPPK